MRYRGEKRDREENAIMEKRDYSNNAMLLQAKNINYSRRAKALYERFLL
jgi:hypothetical protein